MWDVTRLLLMLTPKSMKESEVYHRTINQEKLDKRLANPNPRSDLYVQSPVLITVLATIWLSRRWDFCWLIFSSTLTLRSNQRVPIGLMASLLSLSSITHSVLILKQDLRFTDASSVHLSTSSWPQWLEMLRELQHEEIPSCRLWGSHVIRYEGVWCWKEGILPVLSSKYCGLWIAQVPTNSWHYEYWLIMAVGVDGHGPCMSLICSIW